MLTQTKLLAVKRQTSVSGLMIEALKELVERETAYSHARNRQLAWMEQGFDLGTERQAPWTRKELQQRYQISFWDAMILNNALMLECAILWSEDINHL